MCATMSAASRTVTSEHSVRVNIHAGYITSLRSLLAAKIFNITWTASVGMMTPGRLKMQTIDEYDLVLRRRELTFRG